MPLITNEKEAAVERLLTRSGSYVEDKSDGDGAEIRSVGMEVAGGAAPVGPRPQVTNLTATIGDQEGETDLAWDAVRGAGRSEAQRGTNPNQPGTWAQAAIVVPNKATLTGLPSGTKLWFHGRATAPAGPGPWSDPAAKVVP